MLNNPYLDTIISLTLVFALLSVLVSLLVEAWNQKIKERGVFLQKLIYRLLNDPLNYNYGYHIYQHPIINRMRKDGSSYPYYISADSFCNALIDTVADLGLKVSYIPDGDKTYKMVRAGGTAALADRFVGSVRGMNESDMKRLFTNFIDRNRTADGLDFAKLKDEMGKWYDDFMDRASGEYKQNQRGKLQLIGILVAIALNVDTFHMARVFMLDKPLRDSTVQNAMNVVDHRDPNDTTAMVFVRAAYRFTTDTIVKHRLDSLGIRFHLDSMNMVRAAQADSVFALVQQWRLPIGWDRTEAPLAWWQKDRRGSAARSHRCGTTSGHTCGDATQPAAVKASARLVLPPAEAAMNRYISHRNTALFSTVFLWLLGVVISGYALSFGAPFWFEVLVKLINIRRAGLKPARKDA